MKEGKPWLKHYDAGVPHQLDCPELCIHDLLTNQANKLSTKAAVICGEDSVSYGEVDELARNFAHHLLRLGIKPGDRVGICLANSIEFVVSFFGILRAGGIVAAMNPSFPRRELQFQLATTGMKLVITSLDKIEDFTNQDCSIQPDRLIVVGDVTALSWNSRILSYDACTCKPNVVIDLPVVHPSSPAVVQFSGGTTGTPKAALGSHRNIVANVTQFRHWLVILEDGKETFLIAIPLYHVYGLVLGLVLGVASGATMIFVKNPGNIEEVMKAIDQHPISYFPAVPSIFNMINQHPGVARGEHVLNKIKACISGSAPLMEAVRVTFEKATGGFLVEGYGLSEAPTATHCNPIQGEKRSGSIGIPLPDVDCRIVSLADSSQDVEVGKEGELLISGPQVMLGYFNDPEETAKVLSDGWLHSGDVARMDKDGYFYLSGRIKELIKVHGMQVWPVEVEAVITQHPDVLECAVAGVPDDVMGERVKAWVVLRPNAELNLVELKKFCTGLLAAYKIPGEMRICQSLPKTHVGKVLRQELVREHNEGR